MGASESREADRATDLAGGGEREDGEGKREKRRAASRHHSPKPREDARALSTQRDTDDRG
eukprot:5623859-Alexandrium_andersonii.AAC.1